MHTVRNNHVKVLEVRSSTAVRVTPLDRKSTVIIRKPDHDRLNHVHVPVAFKCVY